MVAAGLTVFFSFLAITLIPVLLGLDDYGPKYADMRDYHVPTVEVFAEQLPFPDFTDYGSATTPGLHVFASIPVRIFGTSETMLQTISCLLGAAFVCVVWWFCARLLPPWLAAAATFPLVLNSYVISGSIWFMTDNTAVLLSAIVIGFCIFYSPTMKHIFAVSAALIAAVMVRQISLWLAAGAWMSTMLDSGVLKWCLPESQRKSWNRGPVVAVSTAICVSLALLVIFFMSWGGLVPPRFQTLHNSGMNSAVPVLILTTLAAYSFPFLLVQSQRIKQTPSSLRILAIGLLCGTVVGLLFESAPGVEQGRFGGWAWIIAEKFPVLGGRSLFLVLGSAAGGVAAAALHVLVANRTERRTQIVLWVFSLSYVLAMTANSQSFQRYYDAQVLMGIAWAIALSRRPGPTGDDNGILMACLFMSVVQLGLSWFSVYSNILLG